MDTALLIVAGAFVASAAFTYLFIKRKDLKDFVMVKVRDAKKFLEDNKEMVPAEFMPLFDDCMETIVDLENAILDGKVSYKEVIEVGYDVLAMYEKIRKLIKK